MPVYAKESLGLQMMKLLIVSDSHGKWQDLQRLTEQEKPDVVLHLGDHIADAQKLSLACPHVEVEAVPGNCDGWFTNYETDRILSYDGMRFFLTHGHGYQVKSGSGGVIMAGKAAQADVILFGHTHRAVLEQLSDGRWLVNPGTAGGVYEPASYAVAWVDQGTIRLELKTL